MVQTITSTAVAKWTPKEVHAGLNAVVVAHTLSAPISPGSVVQMVKIPHHARIYDGFVLGPAAANFKLSVGDGGNVDRFVSTATISTTTAGQFHRFFNNATAASTGVNYQYSLSDSRINRWDTVDIYVGSASASGTLILGLSYYMDGP